MISISNLKKEYGETVACDIPQLTIEDGEMIGLVGNNGAGKTTLFRIMLDLVKPDEGSVSFLFDGTTAMNPADSEQWKHDVAAYIDEGFLIDYLTPREYFDFLGKICNFSDIDERLEPYTQLAGEELLGNKKLIRNHSAGNKQKVGIIATLIQQPRLLILDEPFNFLDPSGQNLLKHVLTDYHQRTQATIVISSHNLQHTIDISTRILLMESGRIIADRADRQQLEEYFG